MDISDYHIHLEGADTLSNKLQGFLSDALDFYKSNTEAQNQFKKVTGISLIELENRLGHLDKDKDKKFSFDKFLFELYKSKLVLTSTKEIAKEFTKTFLTDYFKKFNFIRLGITPSILFEFDHLNELDWLDSFVDAINTVLIENPKCKIELVLETKRKLLTEKIGGVYGFEKNIEYLRYIRHRLNKEVSYSLSICDDASKFPIIEPMVVNNFEKYISFAREFDASISLHMLEQLPNLKFLDKNLWDKVILNKTLELDTIIPVLKRNQVSKLYLIHMCYLFGGAEPSPEERTKNDKKLIQKGLNYIEKLREFNSTIVVCYSSNEKLGFPCVLEYPEFRELIQHPVGKSDDILVKFGTDDPGPFGVKDIEEEMNLVKSKYRI